MPAVTPARAMIVAVPLSMVMLSGAPAFAASLSAGDPCTPSSALDPGLTCVNGIVSSSATPSPAETSSGTGAAPATSDAPTVPQTSTAPEPSTPVQTPAAGSVTSAAPAAPSSAGTTAGSTTAGSTTGLTAGKAAPSTAAATAATKSPAPTVGSSSANQPSTSASKPSGKGASGPTGTTLLNAADLAMAPAGDLPSLAATRSVAVRRVLGPGAVQSPELAGLQTTTLPPVQAVAAVQKPLLAAGQQSAEGGGFRLLSLSGRTLPGILIALATAIVAAVGAGNVRAWQTRAVGRRRASSYRPKHRLVAS